MGYKDDLQRSIVDGYEEYKVGQEREKGKKNGAKRKFEEEGAKKGKARANTRNGTLDYPASLSPGYH